ncbi:MAG: hypothetical protein IPI65_15730 [Bacteroidetes bacterium]|nr:hypothetical protein [Bacteroidota bacterium]
MQGNYSFKIWVLLIVIVICLAIPLNIKSQSVILRWDENYGGYGYDNASDLILINETELIIIGKSSSIDEDVSETFGNGDIWLCKIDTARNLLWEKSFGGSSVDYPNRIVKTVDSGFVIAGYSYSDDGDVG